MKLCFLRAALAIAVFPGALRAEKDLSQDQVAAYVAVVKADMARDGGALAEARKHYQEALELYIAIAKNDPKWHPHIVQYRIAYCRSQLEALRGRADDEQSLLGTSASHSAPETSTPEALERLAELENEVVELRAQLDAVRQERDALAAERDACREARAAAEAETASLAVKLDDALSLLRAADAGDPHAELALLREELDAAARELDAARAAALQRIQNAAPAR